MLNDITTDDLWLMQGDCLDRMKEIPSGSVDMILCDPPYGTTACKWDSIIPLELMWKELKRIVKPSGAIVMTASQPFTTALISSNLRDFRYCLVWDKTKSGNFALAKKQPMKSHEDLCIFYQKQPTYNPEMEIRGNVRKKGGGKASDNFGIVPTVSFNNSYYPKSILQFSTGSRKDHHHPTQKPVALMEYLIKTYTNERETILDFTMGSGTTGVACQNLNRKFIGIEQDQGYFNIAKDRILGTLNAK
jgi:site-specific DNA-methyltransferase (adenine-specific)